jgi:hypothetical protein
MNYVTGENRENGVSEPFSVLFIASCSDHLSGQNKVWTSVYIPDRLASNDERLFGNPNNSLRAVCSTRRRPANRAYPSGFRTAALTVRAGHEARPSMPVVRRCSKPCGGVMSIYGKTRECRQTGPPSARAKTERCVAIPPAAVCPASLPKPRRAVLAT